MPYGPTADAVSELGHVYGELVEVLDELVEGMVELPPPPPPHAASGAINAATTNDETRRLRNIRQAYPVRASGYHRQR